MRWRRGTDFQPPRRRPLQPGISPEYPIPFGERCRHPGGVGSGNECIKMIESEKTITYMIGETQKAAILDPRVKYPSYKSFDEFIDIDRLRSLDGYIRQRIRQHITLDRDLKFYTGPYTLNEDVAGRPGSRMIYLA